MTPAELLWDPFFSFGFMRRALAGTLALALGCAPIGVFLLLKRMTLMGDALAHAILPGAAAGFLLAGLSLPAMSLGGLLAGLTVALAAGGISRTGLLREETGLTVFYLISLAGGVLLVSLRGGGVDLLHVLFGSVLALDDTALLTLAGVATLTLPLLALIFRPLVLECLDPDYLRLASGGHARYHLTFLALVVLNLVAGFQALGTLMAVGLMMLPAACARLWTRTLGPMIAVAIGVALLSGYAGLLLSYHAALPAGPAIIFAAGALLLLSLPVAALRRR